MKRDTCPLCGGDRAVGFFTAYCGDCDTVQRAPEWQRFHEAVQSLGQALRDAFRWRR